MQGRETPCGNRGGGNTGITMLKGLVVYAALLGMAGPALAASAVNRDAEPQTLIVTEGGSKTELVVAAGETVDFCASGCFVTLPNGDLEALTGAETLEISGGVARIK
jgi:hypothetical protein